MSAAPPSGEHGLQGRRVLVVDDDESVRSLLRDFLEHLGAGVEAYQDGPGALERLKVTPFDALVSDLRMPGMDGLQLIGAARGFDPELAVVVMTGFASLESALAAVRLGAHEYLRKPFELVEVRRALGAALASRDRRPLDAALAARLRIGFSCEMADGAGAAEALPPLFARLAARAWSCHARDLLAAGLAAALESALRSDARSPLPIRVRVGAGALRLWLAEAEDGPAALEFPRPPGAGARAA